MKRFILSLSIVAALAVPSFAGGLAGLVDEYAGYRPAAKSVPVRTAAFRQGGASAAASVAPRESVEETTVPRRRVSRSSADALSRTQSDCSSGGCDRR